MNATRAKELAKIMREFAQEHLADGLSYWKGEVEMINMVRGDAKDLRAIAKLLRENKIDEAWTKSCSLDTAVREYIPDVVWDAMRKHYYGD